MVICKEDHAFGQLGQFCHQLETLSADGNSHFELSFIMLLAGKAEIGQRDRIKVVVGEGDETKADAAKVDDLVDHAPMVALPGLLAVCAPD